MKKIMCVAMLIICFALNNVSAYTQINFQTDLADGAGGVPANDALFNASSLALSAASLFLVYFSSDTIKGFDSADPYNPLGGDQFMGAFSTGVYAGEISGNNSVTFGTPGDYGYAGYVYIAVFDLPYSAGTPTIPGGSRYSVANTMATTDFQQAFDDTGMVPLPHNYGTARLETTPLTTSLITPVPEPSTIGLLLVGVGLVALRRFRKA